ncbi:hypothetical protein [Alishewanella longhuensis]
MHACTGCEYSESHGGISETGLQHRLCDCFRQQLCAKFCTFTISAHGHALMGSALTFLAWHSRPAAMVKVNIAAKGLTGPGYDGHYFWDTEVYVIPGNELITA